MTELSVRVADAQTEAHGAGGTVRAVASARVRADAHRCWVAAS